MTRWKLLAAQTLFILAVIIVGCLLQAFLELNCGLSQFVAQMADWLYLSLVAAGVWMIATSMEPK
jgi:hypothetical protein